MAALNLPATQREQGPPLLPVAPALQEQAVAAALAAGECECVGHVMQAPDDVAPMLGEKVPIPQSLHVALPEAALNLPATHSEHGPPLQPVAPALQEQAAATVLAAGESECVGHVMQVPDDAAPMLGE